MEDGIGKKCVMGDCVKRERESVANLTHNGARLLCKDFSGAVNKN